MKQRLVLVGNGMAGVRTLEELLKLSSDIYDIVVFGDEPYENYNRILLSPVLAGEKRKDDIILNDRKWYEQNNIKLHTGKRITKIDRKNRVVTSEDGTVERYDRLLLAVGSTPIRLPIPGVSLRGVLTFRDLHDVDAMIEASKSLKHAVVIGGGLLGLEAATGLKQRGMSVTVVHLSESLLDRQLDTVASSLLRKELEKRGIHFLMAHSTQEIMGKDCVTGVKFSSGIEISADIVVMAVGIRPNTALAKSAGIYCDKGIIVNDTLQTYDPRVYAVGECVQHRGMTYGLVAPLFEQAKVCANHLANYGIGRYEGSVTSTKLKVTGVDLFSAGDFVGDRDSEELIYKDEAEGIYKKLVVKNNKVVGAVLYGDVLDGPWYFQLIREGSDITAFRDSVLFGQAHIGDSGHGEKSQVSALPDTAEICGCNGVKKGDIVKCITQKKLFTLDEVRAHTKASASCGSCTGLVESILLNVVGDYSQPSKKKAICQCTQFSHDEIRAGIAKNSLKDMPSVMRFFDWKNDDGCAKCRPALNYYLISQWPSDYRDDSSSRFINERVHANIQKDGTYSVVPRIWGGLTTPHELRSIADVAEKYAVPTVKITGGQRIDLLGVSKEDLPSMWSDLSKAGFVSGHAYGKSLRTVKTCVGKEWCRFGTQDSMGMGIKLEKMTWGSWTPHKFKMAVSGCPRNCAEATIKDFGVVAVDSGWELHVGGNGGVKVRATDFLVKVESEEEVTEYCAAFMQLYREEAHYLERTAPWIERVGLSYIKQKIVENSKERKVLAERFMLSQEFSQVDPWTELANAQHENEFATIKLSD